MRPRGEVRVAVAAVLAELCPSRGAMSAREVAAEARLPYGGCLTMEEARDTLNNMVRAGEAKRHVGVCEPATASRRVRWHNRYEPAFGGEAEPQPWGGIEALAGAMRSFVVSHAE